MIAIPFGTVIPVIREGACPASCHSTREAAPVVNVERPPIDTILLSEVITENRWAPVGVGRRSRGADPLAYEGDVSRDHEAFERLIETNHDYATDGFGGMYREEMI